MKWKTVLISSAACIAAILVTACGTAGGAASSGNSASAVKVESARSESMEEKKVEERIMTVTDAGGKTVRIRLNDSPAADSLYAQLPLSVELDNYSDNEKIFYPPTKLDTGDSPKAETGKPGTLAYYAPWGDVVLFYGNFRPNPELYELGKIESSIDEVAALTVGKTEIGKN